MVKQESHEDVGMTSKIKVEDGSIQEIEATGLLHPKQEYDEDNLPSSSSSQMRLNLTGMGFSPILIDKAIKKYGEGDMDLLIDSLCSQSEHKPPAVRLQKRLSLLRMNFPVEDVELAIGQLGHEASISELIDFIIAAQIAGSEHEKNVVTTETLFKTREKSLRLLEMGFTEEEISTVIDNFGSDARVEELADSIFRKRIEKGCIKQEDDVWSDEETRQFPDEYESKYNPAEERNKRIFSETDLWETKPSTLKHDLHDWKQEKGEKRPKWMPVKDKSASHKFHGVEKAFGKEKQASFSMGESLDIPGYEEVKPFSRVMPEKFSCYKNENRRPSMEAYIFFGNVTDSSPETWNKLSRFLCGTEPEHVNTQFFSALARNEVYFHNLPTNNRCHIFPRPAMTIEEALPDTKRWWPPWDTRKQLDCITLDSNGVASICERMRRMLVNSKGALTEGEQIDMLHHCRMLNLLWVGEHKLRQIEPDYVEYILGYPMEHTRIGGLGSTDRMHALHYSFQVDTLGYYLSPLKQIYPDGLRVFSVFSGIGGAEIALSRLGIRLHCAVSVESSEMNRNILRRWWENSGQLGVLRQIDSIHKLGDKKIESLIEEFGGFDLIISGNPHSYNYGSDVGISEGVDFNLFAEFVRIFQRLKSLMARN